MPPNVNASIKYAKPNLENFRTDSKNEVQSEKFKVNYISAENRQREVRSDEGWFAFRAPLVWRNIILIALLHIGAIYTLCTCSVIYYKMLLLWGVFLGGVAGFGVTGGCHRLWTHRSYKAKLPLRIILAGCYLVAGENSIYNWVRDHRIHHKFSDTDGDPHNTQRGFFFSHVGWLMLKKDPEVIRRGRQVDMSDITSDPVVQFVDKHFTILKIIGCFVLPIIIPVYCWNEEWYMTIMSQLFLRYPFTLNATWSVNSFAHFWGYRSYDKSIPPAENRWVSLATMGEGWHNYHHAFPWDYKAAELGNYLLNPTTMLIDSFAKIGWAYDLKRASTELIQKVAENRGDGSHEIRDKKY